MKTQILVEALPWIQEFNGEIVVVKYGGNAMVDKSLSLSFAKDIAFLRSFGIKPVVVHGGGPQISTMLAKFGIKSEFKGGFRVTTPEAMDVVRMVLTGKISRELVGMINAVSGKKKAFAVGLSGEDAGLFSARRKTVLKPSGADVNLGLVGDICSVDPSCVLNLLETGRIPVISSVAPNCENCKEVLNVNADVAAGELAAALCARKLIILTDVAGVYDNYPDPHTLISRIGIAELEEMLPKLESGMIPKLTSCLNAVKDGVKAAHIIDGRQPHSLLLEIFTTSGIGTLIQAESAYELECDTDEK
ncbi:MAG: acetylglutamate kinase [Candidatus Ancillula trichonymphae]|jgi:acetylglutamate kinase|nr:acetylglutamate kinase [Candidatus Ancillula trichonymphae]